MRNAPRVFRLPSKVLCALSLFVLAAASANAEPLREWDWHMPAEVYKELDFTDRAAVDRAVKIFENAVDAERYNRKKVTDLLPMYRAAAGEWRKVQVQAETAGGNENLLAYAVFMQGYAKQQAHDRNEAKKLFAEVVDLYPEQKFISVPARYMISVVDRELGDIKKADAALEEIVDDKGADGHKIFYNVLNSLAQNRWRDLRPEEAAELWEKIVLSKGKPDGTLRETSRWMLMAARLVSFDFGNLDSTVYAGVEKGQRKSQANRLAESANWVARIDEYQYHEVTQYLDRKYPREKKLNDRKNALEKIRKGYNTWFESQNDVFEGYDDGWTAALLRVRLYFRVEKPDQVLKRVKTCEGIVKSSKPDVANSRARQLVGVLCGANLADAARAATALAKDPHVRLRLQYEVESAFQQWKMAAMYLEEFINLKPAPEAGALLGAKYDLAWLYRNRLSASEKALKIYREIDDPPRSLWNLAETLREVGKKQESYTQLTEIASVFPNDAPNAVLRMAQWREADGEKEKAIGLYRRLMNHPKWKQSGASSQAHQALERLGIATGGAMTNEVR